MPSGQAKMKVYLAPLLFLAVAGCGRTSERDCLERGEPWCPLAATTEQRAFHVAVWSGKEVLIWGGYGKDQDTLFNTGLRIDPESGVVRPMSTKGAPEGRIYEIAAWTGRELLIWGGVAPHQQYDTGALYDPEADTWRPLLTPAGHHKASATWTGSELFAWSGRNDAGEPSRSGFLLNPETGVQREISSIGAPDVFGADVVPVGRQLVVSGGTNEGFGAASFDLDADVWRSINSEGAIPANFATIGFSFDDSAYFCADNLACAAYSLSTDAWTPFPVPNSPAGYGKAWALSASQLVLFGGQGGDNVPFDEDAVFDFTTKEWANLPAEGRPSPRWGSTLTAISDSRFFLWGGQREAFDLTEEGFVLTLP